MMEPDRSTLANIDRKVLLGLGRQERSRMVRLPISDVLWLTWRRYCDAVGMPMGRAAVSLIVRELRGVVEPSEVGGARLVAERAAEELARRELRVTARERALEVEARRLREWNEGLRSREADLAAREHRLHVASSVARGPAPNRKVGRNERCPCGSGRKYKHCHGSPANRSRGAPGTAGLRG